MCEKVKVNEERKVARECDENDLRSRHLKGKKECLLKWKTQLSHPSMRKRERMNKTSKWNGVKEGKYFLYDY